MSTPNRCATVARPSSRRSGTRTLRGLVLIAIPGKPGGPSTQRGVKINVSLVPAFGSVPAPFLGSVQESASMNTHRLMETGSNITLHALALLAGVILVILGLGLGETIW